MSGVTLYVTDLDGTLLCDRGTLKPRAAAMLNSFIASGAKISYCTARGLASAADILSSVKFNTPVVLMNGVFIYDPVTGEYPVRHSFGERQCELLRRAVKENGETPMIFSFIDGAERVSYIKDAENLQAHLARRKHDKRRRPVKRTDSMFAGDIFYAAFIDPRSKAALDEVFTVENGFRVSCYKDTYPPYQLWYEVFDADAGKANAVLKLKELTGADELVCFGDNANDIPMLEAADRCYAVGNAIPELKAIADDVIGTNEQYGVPEFIERELFPQLGQTERDTSSACGTPDSERFAWAVGKALERERTTIGTLNEKTIHNALKYYYCDESGHETKIGSFFADGMDEGGILEVQSANFTYLAKKLPQMLAVSPVTVVYPFERVTRLYSINEQTGEILSESRRTNSSLSKLFLELYRLKAFLTNPNLTVRIAELEIDKKLYYKDERKIRRRGMKKEKFPMRFISETVLRGAEDYAGFLPDGLGVRFTRAQLHALMRSTDAGLMLSVLEFTGAVRRCGKQGNSIVYERTDIPK
ncbi:MAG: HAD family phosphatase [Ruminiclostridium sp.]|nr:HAD family phosphatase [Ruminiclostridium sp.]